MITKSKLADINLSDLIMDSMPGLVFIFAKDGQMIGWNKKAEEVLGYSPDEMSKAYAGDFSDETTRKQVREAFKDSFLTGYANVEHLIVTKSGRKIPSFTHGKTITIDGEQYLIGLSLDISVLATARKEISRSNQLMQAENIYLKDQVDLTLEHNGIIGVRAAYLFKL